MKKRFCLSDSSNCNSIIILLWCRCVPPVVEGIVIVETRRHGSQDHTVKTMNLVRKNLSHRYVYRPHPGKGWLLMFISLFLWTWNFCYYTSFTNFLLACAQDVILIKEWETSVEQMKDHSNCKKTKSAQHSFKEISIELKK